MKAAPELPGLRLVDTDTSCFKGQIFYLDFDGAEDVTYNGPVTVGPFDVPVYQPPYFSTTRIDEIISPLCAKLAESFGPAGIVFTTDENLGKHNGVSTIYVGGSDSPFKEYGQFFGIAEQIDLGNRIQSDNAYVFPDTIKLYTNDIRTVWAGAAAAWEVRAAAAWFLRVVFSNRVFLEEALRPAGPGAAGSVW